MDWMRRCYIQSLLLLCLVLWAEMVWLRHSYDCRIVLLQLFSAKGQVSNFLRIVNSAFSIALKMGYEEAEAGEG